MEIANLSDAEFKTLVLRMLKELVEYGKSIREEMKATLSETDINPQGTNSKEKETRVQINELEHKEEINSQPEQNEETRIQKKNEERIRSLWGISKCANTWITGAEGKEEEQKIENLFEKLMKENFPNLVKEIDIQVQEAQSPKQAGPKEEHTKTHHN